MESSVDILARALMAGLVCGFVVSVPVGPVNLTLINQALRKGFGAAFLVGLGAIAAETVYAAVMLAGHASILDKPAVERGLRAVAFVAMTGLGVRNLLLTPEKLTVRSAASATRVDERWHHPRALLLGFVLTLSNLMLLVLWATLTAVMFARGWVTHDPLSRVACLGGVLVGGAIWFLALAWLVSRAHRRVTPIALAWLSRGCGMVFLIFAALLAHRLVVGSP